MMRMTGKEVLLSLMRQYGVEYVFGVPGATEVLFMTELEKHPEIPYILGLNEIVSVGMAEGYAKACGKPGFLNLHTYPGLAAAMPLLVNAMAGGVPLVITVGQNDTRLLQYEPQLSGDIVGLARQQTKWSTEITHAEEIPAVLHRAFKTALQPPMGPVLVSIPSNLLNESLDYEPSGGTPVYFRTRPDAGALARAAELIRAAEHPVIFLAEGVARSGAQAEAVRLAELLGARVHQVWMADMNFPVSHPQYLGDMTPGTPPMRQLLEQSDLLIGIGCQLFNEAFFAAGPKIPAHLKVIHIHDDPREIGKNIPTDCGIQADIRTALEELCRLLEDTLSPDYRAAAAERRQLLAKESGAQRAALQQLVETERDKTPITIASLMDAIRSVITEDTLVVDDSWSSSGLLRQILDLKEPDSYFRSRNGGSIGSGLPGALGVKLARPDKKVLAVSGDGSAAWSMQSLWTAAHYRIPVTYVITNNATYRQLKLVRKNYTGDYPLNEKHIGMELDDPVIDFAQLARSMGVRGCRVSDPRELPGVLRSALAAEEPVLVDVIVENSPV